MTWRNILKVELRPQDIKRLGNKYAIMDMYESMLMTKEEYDKLPDLPPSGRRGKGPSGPPDNKMAYHSRLKDFFDKNKDSPFFLEVSKYMTFHNTMYRRLQKQKFEEGFLYETYPTLELFEESGTKGLINPRSKTTLEDAEYNKMFRMLENLFEVQGTKTQEEVESILGRKLKSREIQAYEDVVEKLA